MGAECSMCGRKMLFEEGDVIYGEKWYHNICAKKGKIEQSMRNDLS